MGLVGFLFATNMWQGRIQEPLDDQIASPELQHAYNEREIETGDSLTRINRSDLCGPSTPSWWRASCPARSEPAPATRHQVNRIVAGGEGGARSKDGGRTCQAIEMPDKATRR